MPLSGAALKFAELKFAEAHDNAFQRYKLRVKEISNHVPPGSGDYLRAIAEAGIERTRAIAGAKLNILLTAYSKAGIPFNNETADEIFAGVEKECEVGKTSMVRTIAEVANKVFHGTPPKGAVEATQDEVVRGIDSVKADLNRKNQIMLAGVEMDAGRTAVPPSEKGAHFLPKDSQHDAYKLIRDAIKDVKSSLMIADPYVDGSLWDLLSNVQPGITVRLLTRSYKADFILEASKFAAQHKCRLEIRTDDSYHDRFIVVDSASVTHLGTSIKDAGAKAFMISEVNRKELAALIRGDLEATWNSGKQVFKS